MKGSPDNGAWYKAIVADTLGANLARSGVVALAIRLMSVALSYLMYITLARNMSDHDFGRFGFAFSLATFIAVIAAVGQPMLVLRFIPTYQHDGRLLLVKGLIRDSRLTLLVGVSACAILMLAGSEIWIKFSGADAVYLSWAALLMLVIAAAQHQAFIMRAFGDIVRAMAPRDIFWRIAVIAIVLTVAQTQEKISTVYAINICSFSLIAILAAQTFTHPATRPGRLQRSGSETDRSVWVREARGLWATTVVQAAGPNLSVVVLGMMLSPEETGPFFAALKTATLLTLPLAAGAIVGAPLISRYYHEGQTRKVQLVSSYLVLGITVPVLLGFVLILILGERILGFFGPDFVAAQSALLVIAFGALVNALSGPTAFIMNMTGHHRQFLTIMAVTQLISLMILPVMTVYFGMLGAAAAVAAGMVSWNVWVWRWSRANLAVDPTIFGVVEWLLGRGKHSVHYDEKA